MPLITRLYPPADSGSTVWRWHSLGVAAQVVGLALELAAISARDRDDSRALLLLSALAILPVTCVCSVVLCGLKVLGIGSVQRSAVVDRGGHCATIATVGAYSTLRCWLARRHRFRLVANSLITLRVSAGIPVNTGSRSARVRPLSLPRNSFHV